jgi:hypothetical protein
MGYFSVNFKMRSLAAAILLLLVQPAFAAESAYPVDENLSYHISFGRADDIKILLGNGSNPNASSPQGDTMLTIAIIRNDNEGTAMAQLLLDRGADPNLPDKKKNYPIVLAAKNGEAQIVAALLSKGADFHATTANGTPVIDVARQNGNSDVIKLLQDAIDKEAAYAASLRSPERFKEIVRLYGYHSCSYQYWNYYLASRQDPDKDTQTNAKIATEKTALSDLLTQIQKYYPQTNTKKLQEVADDSAQTVFTELDGMVSNRYRAEQGVGTDDDVKRRCQSVASSINVDFVPQGLKSTTLI